MTALKRLFSEGFRLFFLLSAVWGTVAMLVWGLWLAVHAFGGMMELPADMVPQWWHGHEMIFGFGAAATAGFLLTAVPNWTGAAPAGPRFLILAGGLWLAGRVGMWLWGALPAPLAAGLALAFLPVLTGRIWLMLRAAPKPANLLVLGVVALIWGAQLRVLLDLLGWPMGDAVAGLHGALATLIALIVIIGGRITPAFTRNALARRAMLAGAAPDLGKPRAPGLPVSFAPADRLAVGAAIAAALAITLGLPDPVIGTAELTLGAAQLIRIARWQGWAVRGEPILAVLHAAMALVGFGALLQGLAAFGIGSQIGALHFSAIGGIGTMVSAVMSRATLGHTGRPLVAPFPVALAYALIPLAALLRWAAAVGPLALYTPGTILAATLWALAFMLILIALAPLLLGPRPHS
ncbi:NnrS family protein [Rhodobacter capsulatus]|uniref:NnrS family protein n=1 Tax=Rhodobacter capsulatus (strain ATCC BAA-309 / NBRC 16581 / SB1003) TaxID=272942 RepID=D5AVI7_RHOCB|nr:NnrS family protein [Rhodobacter capsulatus]ADE87322.1 NnrS family protein [Rhodobacter capsulatus SB 1003]MDS0926890.1 NnrS family protein [Rhodobacter capsulatus]